MKKSSGLIIGVIAAIPLLLLPAGDGRAANALINPTPAPTPSATPGPEPAGGRLDWAKRAGGPQSGEGLSVASFEDGSSVITGYFSGTAVFGPGEANQISLSSSGVEDIFIARYNADGTLAWAKRAGGTNIDQSFGVAAFADGSSVITGMFSGNATFGPGEAGQTILSSKGGGDIFIARYNSDGTLAWAKKAGGGNDDRGLSIATHGDGASSVTGWFRETSIFAEGEANETTLVSAGFGDMFIARYNADGNLAWVKRAGSATSDPGQGVAALENGASVVTGYFQATAIFGAGETNETTLVSAGNFDIFIARYNADGTLAWAKRAGGTSIDQSFGVAAFADGSSVITGMFSGNATFGPGEAGQTILSSEGSNDIFIARYNPDGTLAWAKRAGSGSADTGNSIASREDGSSTVTGYFSGTAIFGKGEDNETSLVSAGYADMFIARYKADGTLTWAKSAGSTNSSEEGQGIASHGDGSSTVTGYFSGTAIFGAGEDNETELESAGGKDIFVARYFGASPSPAPSPTPTPSTTPEPSVTPTTTPTATPLPTPTPSPTATPTATPTPATPTPSPLPSCAPPVTLDAKVFLEGAYTGSGAMRTTLLEKNHIPLTSPYADERTVEEIPAGAVDWVHIELREYWTGPAESSRSAFLKYNGRLMDDNGQETILMSPCGGMGSYYIVVRHRNHLDIMSAGTHILYSGGSSTYDFTTGQDKAWGTAPMKEIAAGVFGMAAGDADGSGEVDGTDYGLVFGDSDRSGYRGTDINLSGVTDSTDRIMAFNNSGIDSQVP